MLGMGIIGRCPDKWLKTKNGCPSKSTWTLLGETYLIKGVYGTPRSVRVPSIVPRLLDGMPGRRRRPFAQRPLFGQNRRGIITVPAKSAKIGYKLGRDKQYKRMGAKGVTGYYRHHPRAWER